jgi:hypothetical protein
MTVTVTVNMTVTVQPPQKPNLSSPRLRTDNPAFPSFAANAHGHDYRDSHGHGVFMQVWQRFFKDMITVTVTYFFARALDYGNF